MSGERLQADLADESAFETCAIAGAGGTTIKALRNGCIYSIESGEIQINQILASPLAGGIHRIYLRIHEGRGISSVEIVGPHAASAFSYSQDRFVWSGAWRGLHYRCICRMASAENAWFFEVEVENRSENAVVCDAVMVQDIGLAARGQVRNNENYTSQYLDHFAAPHPELGYVLMTRQNLPQPGGMHPWLLQGCFPKAAGFVTDGFDFFGVGYRATGIPVALSRNIIGERVRQYEAAYTAIQSNQAKIEPSERSVSQFFYKFVADHPEPSSSADMDDAGILSLRAAADELAHEPASMPAGAADLSSPKPGRGVFQTADLYPADDLDESDIRSYFAGELRHDEFDGANRLSFFHGPQSLHVVLKAKEIAGARPHGHIMRSGRGLLPDADVMSCTCYCAGIFGSQMALGNSVFGKFLSTVRDPLNIIRSSGLRILVRRHPTGAWRLLGVPSAFEMGPNFCRWYYKGNGNLLTVTCIASDEDAAFTYQIRSEKQGFEYLICGEIAAGPQEYDSSPRLSIDSRTMRVTIRPDSRSQLAANCPEIIFHAVSSTPEAIEVIGGDELIGVNPGATPLPYFAIRTRPTKLFTMSFVGSIDSGPRAESLCAKYEGLEPAAPSEAANFSAFWSEASQGMRVSSASNNKAAQIHDALAWFARDAIIHFSVPRGLEQVNGGAWGVRDVCQGPVEFLLSQDRSEVVKTILHELFSQQYDGRGDWPQWFMFAPFQQVQSSTCHGDIAIWPLKALCDYLEHTGDGDILHERLPYTDDEGFGRTERRETILQHVDRLLARLTQQFVKGLSIPRYGEGDWDDSLQPVCPELGERMASSWTAALMYQTLRRYGAALAHFGVVDRAGKASEMADRIHADFQRLLIVDGVVAGFTIFDQGTGLPEHCLLHPSDRRTGIAYRLIPMTRGILSHIFSAEQANAHLELIKKHLLFPDGARLMDRPTRYLGGKESVFRRSESAAFFGREIGLQYVHAHLRYAEALALMGKPDELLHALCIVNPIAVSDMVKRAGIRQRNCYFSSSDADFADRYEASRDYDKLRQGDIAVNGGWRIYSSGPGIYTSLVVRHLFGFRRHFDSMEFDPVLPRELDGIECVLKYRGRAVRYQFEIRGAGSIRHIHVNGTEMTPLERVKNPYRAGGLRIRKSDFENALDQPENLVRIEL
jgi:1,2-beta-oligoglucan phosphorylase